MKELTINIPVTFKKVLEVNPEEIKNLSVIELILEQKDILIQGLKRNISYQQEKLYLNKNRVFDVGETSVWYLDKSRNIRCYSLVEIANLEATIESLQEPTEPSKSILQNKDNYALMLHSLSFINQSDEFPWNLYHALIELLAQ